MATYPYNSFMTKTEDQEGLHLRVRIRDGTGATITDVTYNYTTPVDWQAFVAQMGADLRQAVADDFVQADIPGDLLLTYDPTTDVGPHG